jgi:hypothetical protein
MNGHFLKKRRKRTTVSFTDLDQGREIFNRFSLPKSMKHSVEIHTFSHLTI